MKKLFSILCLAAAGLWLGSCEQDHIDVIYHPSDVVAPGAGTLSGPADGVLSAEGAPIVLAYTKADYGVATNVNYSVYVDQASVASAASAREAASVLPDLSKMTRISAAVVSTDPATITIPQKDLNSVLLDWGILPGEECTVRFIVVTSLATEKGTSVEGTEFYSEAVIAQFTPYNADVNDVDKYEHVWVIGDFNGWNFDKVDQYLYAYKGGSTYTGLIDFGDKAANGFKMTGAANWDNGNWGLDKAATAPEAEAASVQLINDGGSGDIKCYSKRFYMFEFDRTSLVLKKTWSADQIGIIGLNGDWNNDIVMEYNAYKHRFYADITVADATEMKFRADSDWTLNWGVDLKGGGDNIPVEAGNYRVYLDFNNGEYTFDEKMYQQEEPTAPAGGTEPEPEPEPEPEVKTKTGLWSVVGKVNGADDWDVGVYMAASEHGLWVSPVTTLAGEFKLRWNNGWDINRGGAVTVGTASPVTHNGDNMKVDEAGDYVVIYDPKAETVTVQPANQGLGMIGDALSNGWDKDTYHLLETSAGSNIFTTVAVFGEGKFKIRQDCDWDSKPNYGGTFKAFGQPFEAVVKGPDIEVKDEKGEYVVGVPVLVTLNLNDNTITIDKLAVGRWGVVGAINGTNWNSDVLMVADGTTFRSMPFVADGELKIRKDGDWKDDRGGEFAAFDTAFPVTKGGSNIKNDALTGKSVYLVYDAAAETITISEYK